MKPILLNFKTTQEILIEYGKKHYIIVNQRPNYMLYEIFKDYIEPFKIKRYEWDHYEKDNHLDITSGIRESYRLKKDLTKQEKNSLESLRKRIFDNTLFFNDEYTDYNQKNLLFFGPYSQIDELELLSYKRKMVGILISFYKSYKYYEILFGNEINGLLNYSITKHYKNYLTMLENYKLVKDQDWIKYLFDNCDGMGDFYIEQLETLEMYEQK